MVGTQFPGLHRALAEMKSAGTREPSAAPEKKKRTAGVESYGGSFLSDRVVLDAFWDRLQPLRHKK